MDWIAPLLAWYERNARPLPWRSTRDPYHILVSEVMLQQTRVSAVLDYYARFLSQFPDLAALALADDDALMKAWEGLGYYSRAKNLKRAAAEAVSRYSGALPADYDALALLPGLGAYTAGAVASIAFSIPVPAVDGNVLRVLARLENDARDISDPSAKRRAREKLLASMPQDEPGRFNQALMELGALVCVPNGEPRCALCPVAAFCRAREAGTEQLLPVKTGKKPRRVEEKTVFALTLGGKLLGYRRQDSGLLASLWQLPDEPGLLNAEQMAYWLAGRGLTATGELLVCRRKHIFTHVEWHMLVCRAAVSGAVPDGWTPLDDDAHALPTAYRVCLE